MSAFLTLSGSVLGLPEGNLTVGPLTVSSAAPVGSITNLTPVSGDNVIPIPAGTTAILVTLPTGNLIPIKVKGLAADAGLSVSRAGWLLYPPDPSQASFILNAGGPMSQAVEITFI